MSSIEHGSSAEFTGDISETAARMQQAALEYARMANRFVTFADRDDIDPELLQPLLDTTTDIAEDVDMINRRVFSTVTRVSDKLNAPEKQRTETPCEYPLQEPLGPRTNIVSKAEELRQLIIEHGPVTLGELKKLRYGSSGLASGSFHMFKKWTNSIVEAGYISTRPDGTYVHNNYQDKPDETEPMPQTSSVDELLSVIRGAKQLPRKSRNRF